MPITSTEKPLENRADLKIQDSIPLHIPKNYSAVFDLTESPPQLPIEQEKSELTIQNLSTTSAVIFYINPSPPDVSPFGEIPANDPEPRIFIHDWSGTRLKVSNVSQQDVIMEVTLRKQPKPPA